MSDKEATVYVVDVGRSMGDKHHGRDVSDLDWAMQYVWDKITSQVATGRKTLFGGVLGFRTDETDNILQSDEGYNNITTFQNLQQLTMPEIRSLHDKVKPSRSKKGDAISAVIVAQQMIANHCKHLKFKKKIILVTNGDGPNEIDSESISQVAAKLKEDAIELVVLGTDFDDEEYGFKEEGKSDMKRDNEVAFKQLTEQSDGVFGTLQEAVQELGTPRVKVTRPIPSYKGKLRLGDSAQYESALEIDVERYPRTMVAPAPIASRYSIKSEQQQLDALMNDNNGGEYPAQEEKDGGIVHQNRTYEIKDESVPGGKREVERDELAKGYSYGNSAVHVEQSDENVTKLETTPGLDIIGFIPAENYKHYISMSRTSVIVAQRTNDLAAMALSAFIRTLHELQSYAVARLVTKDWRPPVVLVLAPEIRTDIECLIDVEVPFAEDFRQHKFPPLDRIITVSGKERTEHRNLPTDELKKAMNEFVDSMDLSKAGEEDGEPSEYMKFEDTFSPKLHRIHQAVQYRAVHPNNPVPPPPDALIRFSHPPQHVLDNAQPAITKLSSAANIKKVPPRAKGRARFGPRHDADQPKSGLDVRALLSSARPQSSHAITPANAIPEFKQAFEDASSTEALQRAVSQLGAVLRTWVTDSVGDAGYARALEALGVMRAECVELEVAHMFNAFLEAFKADLFAGSLGGDRREMWFLVRRARLGPIVTGADARSEYDEERARLFMLPDRTAATE